jgi:hypothetical protein
VIFVKWEIVVIMCPNLHRQEPPSSLDISIKLMVTGYTDTQWTSGVSHLNAPKSIGIAITIGQIGNGLLRYPMDNWGKSPMTP